MSVYAKYQVQLTPIAQIEVYHVVKQCLQHPPRGYPCYQVPNTSGNTSILLSKYLNGHVGHVPYFFLLPVKWQRTQL